MTMETCANILPPAANVLAIWLVIANLHKLLYYAVNAVTSFHNTVLLNLLVTTYTNNVMPVATIIILIISWKGHS